MTESTVIRSGAVVAVALATVTPKTWSVADTMVLILFICALMFSTRTTAALTVTPSTLTVLLITSKFRALSPERALLRWLIALQAFALNTDTALLTASIWPSNAALADWRLLISFDIALLNFVSTDAT